MGEQIKAIETYYNGYKFRSRLEARWAVFFDALRIPYEYEPEGFDLDGTLYLPDFYLPAHDIYVEIKPFDPNVVNHVGDGNIWEKKCALFRDKIGKAIFLCYKEPAANVSRLLYAWDCGDSSAGSCTLHAVFTEYGDIVVEPNNHDICINSHMDTNHRVRVATDKEWVQYFEYFYDPDGDDYLNWAKTVSRQARFEHGAHIDFESTRPVELPFD